MRYGDRTTLKRSYVIQKRVIGALLMREIITRYGRNNIGFLWLFVEPLLMTGLIVIVWGSLRLNQHSTLNIIAFVATGYPLMMMWRNTANRTIGTVSANIGLIYHRNVKVIDALLSRMILEIAGATIAQIMLMSGLILAGLIPMPQDLFYMILAWGLMAIFASGLGLIICTIANWFEPFGRIWKAFSFIMISLSGTFFFVHNMPATIQPYLLKVPMIHGSEMFRHGYFGDTVITYEDPFFLLWVNLSLWLIGLLLVKRFSKGIEPQ